jgi:succinate dehydrogenase/fumarate reductase cytochrome b subunit (b558 family)
MTGRRLLTVTGVAPLGVFLAEHLLANASAMAGGARFDAVVGAMARSPVALLVEIVLVVVPLLVHGAVGVSLTFKPDPDHSYASDRAYKAQRIAGLVALVFVVAHVFELRLRRLFGGLAVASLYTKLSEDLSWTWAGVPWVALGYIVGIAATVFHFGNGLWAFLAARGNQPSRSMTNLILALGGALFLVGTATTISVATGTRLLPAAEGGKSVRCGPDTVPSAAPPTASSR